MLCSTNNRQQLAIAAMLSGCSVIVIVLLVKFWQPMLALDVTVSAFVNVLRCDVIDHAMIIITSMADAKVLVIADTAIILLLLTAKQWRTALSAGFLLLLCSLSVAAIKWFVARERPIPELYNGISAFSFPSGHTANFAAMAVVLIWLATSVPAQRSRVLYITLLLMMTALVGLSRLYLHAHWPSDVIAAYLLTFCVACVGCYLGAKNISSPRPAIFRWTLFIWLCVACVHAITQFTFHVKMYPL